MSESGTFYHGADWGKFGVRLLGITELEKIRKFGVVSRLGGRVHGR